MLLPELKVKEQRYLKSGLTIEKTDDLHKELLLLMKTKKPYLKNELSLKEIAVELNIHPNYLSQVINEKIGKNFYDFVNEYRVNEFKNLIRNLDKQNFTMLALAYECGFNSKSSFNKYFRKSTGMTPSEFSKTVKKQH